MPAYTKVNGVWRTNLRNNHSSKVNGVYRTNGDTLVKVGGMWKHNSMRLTKNDPRWSLYNDYWCEPPRKGKFLFFAIDIPFKYKLQLDTDVTISIYNPRNGRTSTIHPNQAMDAIGYYGYAVGGDVPITINGTQYQMCCLHAKPYYNDGYRGIVEMIWFTGEKEVAFHTFWNVVRGINIIPIQ